MFHFPAFASNPLWIQGLDTFILQPKMPTPAADLSRRIDPRRSFATPVAEGGFPHSEILGSKLVRSSPGLIAAYHVLHRLSAPRHPPDALLSLDRSHCRRTLSRTGSLLLLPVLGSLDAIPYVATTRQNGRRTRDLSLHETCPSDHGAVKPRGAIRITIGQPVLRPGRPWHLTSRPRSHRWNRNHRTCLLFTMTSRTSAPDTPSGEPAAMPFFVLGCSQDPASAPPSREPRGIDRRTCPAQNLRRIWWSQTGSNRRPHACKARALPTELWPLGDLDRRYPRPGEPGPSTSPWTTIWWA